MPVTMLVVEVLSVQVTVSNNVGGGGGTVSASNRVSNNVGCGGGGTVSTSNSVNNNAGGDGSSRSIPTVS